MRTSYMVTGALGLVLAACTGGGNHAVTPVKSVQHTAAPDASGDDLLPLHGSRLTGPTGVQIINGDSLIDLDTRQSRRIIGLPQNGARSITAFQVRQDTILSVDCSGQSRCSNEVFVLTRDRTHARRLAGDAFGAPGLDGVWLTRYGTGHRCTASEVTVTGGTIVPPAPIDCGLSVRAETPLGLLASGEVSDVYLDPRNHLRMGTTVTGRVLAVSGSQMVTWDGSSISVLNRGGHRIAVRTPTAVGNPGDGLVSPDGRHVAIEFGNPACPGPRQCMDFWVLDLTTAHWTRLPSMPVAGQLKDNEALWGSGNRLIILGSFEGVGDRLIVWRPGQSELALRQISVPKVGYGIIVG